MAEYKTVYYEYELTKNELSKLKEKYAILEQQFINLESEYSKIKEQYNLIISKESYFKSLEFKFNEKDEKILKLSQEIESNDTGYRKDKYANELKYEKDISQLKYIFENNIAKVDNATQMEKYVPFLLEQIQNLQSVIKNYENEERKRAKEREMLFEKEYSSMKKKMLEYIKVGKTKGRNLTINQIELQHKLNMMNHKQLLNELEFQSVQIETLLKERQNIDQIIREAKSDLNLHLELEKGLLEKNRKLVEKLKSLSPTLELEINKFNAKSPTQKNNNESHTPGSQGQALSLNKLNMTITGNRTMKANLFNQSLSGYSTQRDLSVSNDKKKLNFHKELIQKQKEIENLKGQYNTLKDKMDSIQSKFKNIILLCEEALEKISNDPELHKENEIFINIDEVKSCDFNSMTIEQKYSTLTMLINYLFPLVNKEVLQEELNKKSFEKVERKFYLQKNNSAKMFNPFIDKRLSMIFGKKALYKTPKELYKMISSNKKANSPIKQYSIFKLN